MSNLLFPLGFKRQYAGPLDADSVFTTMVELQNYLTNDLRYPGQIATCLEKPASIFVMSPACDEWNEYAGEKGENGFTPMPEITTEEDGEYLNFIVGYHEEDLGGGDMVRVPMYAWDAPIKVSGKDETNTGGGGSSTLTEEFTVRGVNIGLYKDGDTIAAGSNLEDIIKNILTAIVNPVYDAPTISFSTSDTLIVESGTTISPILNTLFSKNDAGDVVEFRIKENGTAILTQPLVESTYTVASAKIVDASNVYTAEVDYDLGPIKKTNLGNDYPTGQIQAGTETSASITFKGVRKAFYGTDSTKNAAYTVGDEIRALTGLLNVLVGTNLSISIPVGAKMVVFAYPETLRDVSSVKYVEGSNAEVSSIFSKTVVSVPGAEGGDPVDYKVYTFIPASPFTATATYNVTI